MKFVGIGYIVSVTLFLVLCGLSIRNSKNSTKLSELGLTSIAPQNLLSSAESLRLGLAVETDNKSTEIISGSKSWAQHEKRLTAYTERLELLEEQRRKQSGLISKLSVASSLSMLLFTIALMKGKVWKRDSTSSVTETKAHS